MQRYEFKVVPAPRRGDKVRGLRATEDRFAFALMQVMNDLGRDGWDYVRADTLPCDERVGLTGTRTSFQNMLVFRRGLGADMVADPGAVAGHAPARLQMVDPAQVGPRLGAAQPPVGPSPALGPANAGVAAE